MANRVGASSLDDDGSEKEQDHFVREREIREPHDDGSGIAVDDQVQKDLKATDTELEQAREAAAQMSRPQLYQTLESVVKVHRLDPNFPNEVMLSITAFLDNDEARQNPEQHVALIEEMKLEAALITTNSPYAEVRAVVENTDDPTMPSFTFRTWVLGSIFTVLFAGLRQFFSLRLPSVSLNSSLIQLLAFPCGKAMAKLLPDWGITIRNNRYSINPGPFNKKEHMLITIFAGMAYVDPYTNSLVIIQYLPHFFNQPWVLNLGYQLTIAFSTQFIGFGMAGLTRRFLVTPSYCVWPTQLVTIALNKAFHMDDNSPLKGPFNRFYTISRLKFFGLVTLVIFIYEWGPMYLCEAMFTFSWIEWLAPGNTMLSAITGGHPNGGLGINPLPTFDMNSFALDPFVLPFFSVLNIATGMFAAAPVILIMWVKNIYNTAYLPIVNTHSFDHFGKSYQVDRILDDHAQFSLEGYQNYSPAFMAASHVMTYSMWFALYAATLSFAFLYHGHEMKLAVLSVYQALPWVKSRNEEEEYQDIHNRLMSVYARVPNWWYFTTVMISIGLGWIGLAVYPTSASPFTIFYGLILCVLFILPCGIIQAVTGVSITLNVLAEFIGGLIAEGNALAMNFFKTFGYVTMAHALTFAADLKLAHYLKIPPRDAFIAQMAGSLICTVITVGVMNWQLTTIENVCTDKAVGKMKCPGEHVLFTASVFWGTLGPRRIWGIGGQYALTLIGFPIGFALPFVTFYLHKWFPKKGWIRAIHPVVFLHGAFSWGPLNFAWYWPTVPVGWLSWVYFRKRWLGVWQKYNYILSAGIGCGIGIAAILIFFALQVPEKTLDWAGNTILYERTCAGQECGRLLHLGEGEYFGPRMGEF